MTEAKYDVPLDTEYSSQNEEEREGLLDVEKLVDNKKGSTKSADKALEHDVSLQNEKSHLDGGDDEDQEIQEENNSAGTKMVKKTPSQKSHLRRESAISQISLRQGDYELDIFYLIGLTMTVGLSSMQFMVALNGTCQIAPALRYQQDWGDNQSAIDYYITVLSTASIIGISVGSVFGGDFVKAYGSRKTIIYFNIVGLVGSLLGLTLNFKTMVLGRFSFGYAGGVIMCATSKMLEETIPVRLLDKGFGTSTNILMQLFNFTLLLMAIGMPEDRTSLEKTMWWRCIYGVQIPFQVLIILLHTYYYQEETVKYCLAHDDKPQALRAIKRIHPTESEDTHELIYEEKKEDFIRAQQENTNSTTSVWQTLTDRDSRGSAWMGILVAFFNVMSGVCFITVYAIIIFEKLLKNEHLKVKAMHLTSKQDSYFVGFAGLTGAIISYYSIAIFSRRAIFIGGHFFMGVLLMISGYYIHMQQPELVLLSFCSFVVVYQSTQGSCLYIYIAEIVVNEVSMGLSLLTMMMSMTVQSMFSTYLINGNLGLDILFYLLGLFQLVPVIFFTLYMHETQGLTSQQKKSLYLPEIKQSVKINKDQGDKKQKAL